MVLNSSMSSFSLASKIYPLTQVPVPSSDVYADVASRWDCQEYYGEQKWFAGHRNGESGLNNPNTQDINSNCALPTIKATKCRY